MTEPVNGKPSTDRISTQSSPKNTTTQNMLEKSKCIFTDRKDRPQILDTNIFKCPAVSTRVEPRKCLPSSKLEEKIKKHQEEIKKQQEEIKKKEEEDNKQIASLIEKNIKNEGGDISTKDVPYWTKSIYQISKTYNIPPEMLVTIIGKESFFEKNIGNENGQGPMGVTGSGVRSFFPGSYGNWNNIYKEMNEPLLNDILYKKDSDGKFIKNANGDFVLKYKTPEALRDACSKDDELGIKVGALIFQMDYAIAVGEDNFKGPTWRTTLQAIEAIQDGKLKPNKKENIACLTNALKRYNTVFETYAPTAIKFLIDNDANLHKCCIHPKID